MIPKEALRKIKKIELKMTKSINNVMHGDFHSIFKGTGIEFDDHRAYQYGDDVRSIDWNLTAKGDGAYIKTYREQKEQSVFFLIDVSASQEVGNKDNTKLKLARELCSVLCLSASRQKSQVGLLAFSDQKEAYVKPGKGDRHIYGTINKLYNIKPKSTYTHLDAALRMCMSLLKRKSVLIIISDFIDEGYERSLKSAMHKHDVIVLHLAEAHATQLKGLGIIPMRDKESGRTIYVNTNSGKFKNQLKKSFNQNQSFLSDLCNRNRATYSYLNIEEDYLEELLRLFKKRNKAAGNA